VSRWRINSLSVTSPGALGKSPAAAGSILHCLHCRGSEGDLCQAPPCPTRIWLSCSQRLSDAPVSRKDLTPKSKTQYREKVQVVFRAPSPPSGHSKIIQTSCFCPTQTEIVCVRLGMCPRALRLTGICEKLEREHMYVCDE
jgi:hypothetical protein